MRRHALRRPPLSHFSTDSDTTRRGVNGCWNHELSKHVSGAPARRRQPTDHKRTDRGWSPDSHDGSLVVASVTLLSRDGGNPTRGHTDRRSPESHSAAGREGIESRHRQLSGLLATPVLLLVVRLKPGWTAAVTTTTTLAGPCTKT